MSFTLTRSTEAQSEGGDEASSAAGVDPSCSIEEYRHWLVDLILKVLARKLSSRLLSVQLCIGGHHGGHARRDFALPW